MEGALNVWIVILAVGALNYLSRLSFIAAFGRRSMPAWLARSLKFVPAAMLTALVLPMIVAVPTVDATAWVNPRVLAAIAAAAARLLHPQHGEDARGGDADALVAAVAGRCVRLTSVPPRGRAFAAAIFG